MLTEDYQRESLALLRKLVALQESPAPIDQYYAVSATKGFFLDFKGRRHLYLFTPTAITLLLPDTGGTLAVAANTWTEISHRPGLQLFTSSAQTADVQVLVRASDETIDAIQQVGGTVTANQGTGAAAGTFWRVAGDFTEPAVTSLAATGNLLAPMDVSAYKEGSVQLSGTWSATIQVSGCNDNTNFRQVQVHPI